MALPMPPFSSLSYSRSSLGKPRPVRPPPWPPAAPVLRRAIAGELRRALPLFPVSSSSSLRLLLLRLAVRVGPLTRTRMLCPAGWTASMVGPWMRTFSTVLPPILPTDSAEPLLLESTAAAVEPSWPRGRASADDGAIAWAAAAVAKTWSAGAEGVLVVSLRTGRFGVPGAAAAEPAAAVLANSAE